MQKTVDTSWDVADLPSPAVRTPLCGGRPPPPETRERRIRRRAHSRAECRPCVVDRPSRRRRKVFLAVEGDNRKTTSKSHAKPGGQGSMLVLHVEVGGITTWGPCPRWIAERWESSYARTPARTASTTASPWITSTDFLVSR
jgi:hypothetical protein